MAKAKPTAKQMEWADLEIGVLIHYLMDIYNPDYEGYKTAGVRTELSPSLFRPTRLDPEQWVKSACALGAKYAVLVVNHCTGFSLWQTKVNDYSVASAPWKNGKGDILREFVDACNKYGMLPGVYYSTGCNGYYDINDEEEQDYRSEKYRSFVAAVEAQVKEIWSEYGEMFEVWFDGGIVPKEQGGPDITPLLDRYQPGAIAFQGPRGRADNVRWVGNENGMAPENCWGSADPDGPCGAGSPDGEAWIPAETDFPNRSDKAFGGGWGWRKNERDTAFSPRHLLDCYVNSVGRNTNMLVGMAISTEGDFEDEEQFVKTGELLKKTFAKALAEKTAPAVGECTLTTDGKTPLGYFSIREDITEGHAIRGFELLADGKTVASGECVGHRRIIPLNGMTANAVTFRVTASDGEVKIRDVALYPPAEE